MKSRDEQVIEAAVALVNQWRRDVSARTHYEMALWRRVDRMQQEETTPYKSGENE